MAAGARLIPKLLFQLAVMLALYGALLFGGAGTLDWPSGWAFLAVFGLCSVSVSLWLAFADPDLLEERMKPPVQKAQKTWDKLFLLTVGVAFLAWICLMGVDARRFHWSHAPLGLQLFGAVLQVLSYAGIAWVFRTNSFAAPVIKMQQERDQRVISTGPYAFVRHPMYAFGSLSFFAGPMITGSLWALAILPIIFLALHLRTLGEEKMLRAELEGYEAYARRVRWRYAPGVW
ncbi:isoprenylcysteine carboxylmethyltransferase family protein [Phenylobacterium sp.]|uniref:methyltransferase family protein n=1 Tax=Phenylobacterium sp. TaxID=1871053 RepID=UPI00286CD53E|nr:isoprenylcysteine carboxylmethyltransferase family protein [Phenylobacterium sp.]